MIFGLHASGVFVVVHSERAPGDDEWNRCVEEMAKHASRIQGVFVYTAGGAPSASQRKALGDMWQTHRLECPVAVVMRSYLRAVLTALNWLFETPLQAFAPSAFDQALDCLRLAGGERASAMREIRSYCRQLGIPVLGERASEAASL